MYLSLIALVAILYLFNSRLALAGLIVAIVWMYVQRTRPRRSPAARSAHSEYEAGYQ